LGIPQQEARAYIDRYFQRYVGVKAFIEKTLEETRKTGSVRTAINTPLQGTAADLIKLAMISIDRKLTERELKTRMVLQVHDELLFEVPADEVAEVETLVRTEMEGVIQLSVPLVADLGIGANWRDL
jgi:DNA polymerase-1